MNLGDMINEVRVEMDDANGKLMVSDAELTTWINEGVNEAYRRAHVMVDSSTSAICQINLTVGQAEYAYDPRVLFIKRACLAQLQNRILRPVKVELMDRTRPNWQSVDGDPLCYVIGLDSGKITFFPNPTHAYTVNLTVSRLPLQPLVLPSDSPECEVQWHQSIVKWALYRAFSKKDSDVFDMEKARDSLAHFEQEFGTRADGSAYSEFLNQQQQTYVFNTGEF